MNFFYCSTLFDFCIKCAGCIFTYTLYFTLSGNIMKSELCKKTRSVLLSYVYSRPHFVYIFHAICLHFFVLQFYTGGKRNNPETLQGCGISGIVLFYFISAFLSQNVILPVMKLTSSVTGMRTCSMVSRSRTVTQLSAGVFSSPTVSKSTVTQNGVPISS